MSMADHVDRIMIDKKGYFRVTGKQFSWFERQVRISDRNFAVEVHTAVGTLPRDMADPVWVTIYDSETKAEVEDPIPFDSLKKYLGENIVERIETRVEEQLELELAAI